MRSTTVEASYIQDRRNFRLFFGEPIKAIEHSYGYNSHTRKSFYFEPGQIFGIDLWEKNQFGTVYWQVYVLQALSPGELGQAVPTVIPAAEVLLNAIGRERAARALKAISEIQNSTPLYLVPKNRWLTLDFNLKAANKFSIRKYNHAQIRNQGTK